MAPGKSKKSGRPKPRKPSFGPEKASSLIEGKFKSLKKLLLEEYGDRISTEILSFIKQDGSVTVDLVIRGIAPDVNIDQLLLSAHEKIDQTGVTGAWISVGFYNPPTATLWEDAETKAGYRRVRGQVFYKTFSRRWQKKLAAAILEQARWSQENFFKQRGIRPIGVVFRAWWSPEGKRPKTNKGEAQDDASES